MRWSRKQCECDTILSRLNRSLWRRFRHDRVFGPMGESNDASAFLDAAFQPETDRLTRTTVREGNAVTFMPRGEQSYERRWQLIQDAKRTVHLVTFSVINDDTSRRLVDVLAEKGRQGVEVAIVCDDAALYTTRSRGLLNQMRSAGAEVICYDPPFRHLGMDLRRQHKFRSFPRLSAVLPSERGGLAPASRAWVRSWRGLRASD